MKTISPGKLRFGGDAKTLFRHSLLRASGLAVVAGVAGMLVSCTATSPSPTATGTASVGTTLPAEEVSPPPSEWRTNLPVPPDHRLSFQHLSLEDGLSQSVVLAIAQDPDGFMWLGTQDGLNRYDGVHLRIFRHEPDDPASLIHSYITSLLVDSAGVLWVGTPEGLDRYDPGTESFSHFRNDPADPNSLSENSVTSLAEDSLGYLWVGTSGGVSRLDPSRSRFDHYHEAEAGSDGLSSNTVAEVYVDRQDVVWIGTDQGLDRLDPALGTFRHYAPDPNQPGSLLGEAVSSVLQDRFGAIWVGTADGLNRMEASGQFTPFAHNPDDADSLADNTVTNILEDSAGTLWIATDGGGLERFDPVSEGFLHSRHDPADPASLAVDAVFGLLEDSSGLIWVGTFGSGVDRYDPRRERFVRLRHDPQDPGSLSEDRIWTIQVDSGGALWVGTAGAGLNRSDASTGGFQHYGSVAEDETSLSNDQVFRVFQDRRGTIWIGTATSVDRYDPLTDSFVRSDLPPGFVFLESHDATFWIGTIGGGLMRLNRSTGETQAFVHSESDPTSVSGDFITTLLEDDQGRLWMGTFTAGLNVFDPETGVFEAYRHRPEDGSSLPSDIVLSLHRDRGGRLWVGTSAGLAWLDESTGAFQTYDESDGLANSVIYVILEADDGALWLSTNRGLSRFEPETASVKNYDVVDGVGSREFNQGAGFQGDDGEMYFGGIEGVTIFHPDEIRDDPAIPPVVLTTFYLFNEPVPIGADSPLDQAITETKSIELQYQDDFLAFDYAALNYRAPSENRYAYLLEGYDRGWNEVGTRTFASYTGVPPGEYVFRVRGSNADGVWNDEGTALKITIPPPFWRTWWFSLIAVAVVTGAVAGGVTLRLRFLEGQRQALEHQVQERTRQLQAAMEDLRKASEAAQAANRAKSVFLTNVSHELRTPLNAIIGFSQLMLRSAATGTGAALSPDQQDNLRVIRSSGEHLLGLINDVLDLSKIESGRASVSERAFDLRRLLEALEDMFRLRADQKGLALEFVIDPALPRFILADEGKLRQILMNLLGNAVKFTRTGGVILRAVPAAATSAAEITPDQPLELLIEVEDTGPGLTDEELGTIFTPFVQSAAGIEAQEGTGLGLAISQQFARLLHGDLTAESDPGRGSIFRLRLPARRATREDSLHLEAARQVVGLEPGQPEARILVVDDSEVNRKLLVRLFEPLGLLVREARDGAEAIEIWEAWSPHLIWMDMRMPVMDGYEATRRIKVSTQGQATVIIALTASALEEDRAVILSEGCDDYVRKPFRESDLFEMLTKHLGLRFVYQDVEVERVGGAGLGDAELLRQLAEIPADWRGELKRASLLGYPEEIARLLEAMRPAAPEIIEWLDGMAQAFDHHAILEALAEADRLYGQ